MFSLKYAVYDITPLYGQDSYLHIQKNPQCQRLFLAVPWENTVEMTLVNFVDANF